MSDTFHGENPNVNDWMGREKPKPGSRNMSAQVQRLARRLGKDPDELAQKIPADTLRRTKYPVLEIKDEHGRRVFKHDPGIENDKRRAL